MVAAGGCPPVSGNSLRLLPTGEEEFAALERHIREAKHSIHITTFILGRDEVGRRIVHLLAARARAGVKVRLLLDALGCLTSRGLLRQPLREAGGEIGRFMPVLPVHFAQLGQPAQPPQDRDFRPRERDHRRAQPRPRIHGPDRRTASAGGTWAR